MRSTECLPSEASNESDELVQIFSTNPADSCAGHNRRESERVLQPLDTWIGFAAAREEPVLHNSDSWE